MLSKSSQIQAGGVAQMVEGLSSKYEALSSNASTAKKKREGKKPDPKEYTLYGSIHI
jgi:hypothetical protein